MSEPDFTNTETGPSLHFLVGGLHSKVDILLAREVANSKRLDALERRYWIGAGLGLAMLVYLSGPKGLIEPILRALAAG